LHEHNLTSTKASLSSVKILGYITTSAKIGDGSWHGTDENLILNWQEKFRLYECPTPSSGHFTDEQKLTVLQNAVHPLQEIRQVHIKKDLDYNAFSSLLL
jgi:hypothetical protein